MANVSSPNRLGRISARVLRTIVHHVASVPRSEQLVQVMSAPIFTAQLRAAHANSELSALPFFAFLRELHRYLTGRPSRIDFDENYYLLANPEVARDVRNGVYHSGYVHFCLHGRASNRLHSTTAFQRRFAMAPHLPDNWLTRPTRLQAPTNYAPDLSALPCAAQRTLAIVVPYLRRELFFAGYSSFFHELSAVFGDFSEIVVIVLMEGVDASLVSGLAPRVTVLPYTNLHTLKQRPDLVFCFDYETFFLSRAAFPTTPLIYYCQDFEPGLSPYGTDYIRAQAALVQADNLIISTALLGDFLRGQGLLSARHVFTTSPKINVHPVTATKSKRLFFYFRPEIFTARNLPELILQAVEDFTQRHSGYELYLVGTAETGYSFRVNGSEVYVVSKLPTQDYVALLTSCDAAVSLIYSAHPGVIAFEAAASGIPTVTNIFGNRDAKRLRQISENIVPYDPVRDRLVDCIEQALTMPKGQPSFVATKYSGDERRSFRDFVAEVLEHEAPKSKDDSAR